MSIEKSELLFEYEGAELKKGIEATSLKQVLDGFNRLVQDAAHLLNGEEANVSFRITSVRSNSLDIQSILEVSAAAQAALPFAQLMFDGAKTVGQLIKAWLDIQRHLGGGAAQVSQNLENGNAINISNNTGSVLIVNNNTFNSYNSLDISKSTRKIAAPFKQNARTLTIKENRQILGEYDDADAAAFQRAAAADRPLETRGEVLLTVKAPVLEGDGGCGDSSNGSGTINARMNDINFRSSVESGSKFLGTATYFA